MSVQPNPTRRTVLSSAGVAAITLCLGGCAAGSDASGAGGSGPVSVAASEIPVGGGKIVGRFVVTQPTQGSFAAFSYLCTHQNLPVQQVSDTSIGCGRHGSNFSVVDGSVLTGPATVPLTPATVTVSGDALTIG